MLIVVTVLAAFLGFVLAQWSHVLLHRSPMRMRARRPLLHCRNCGEALLEDRRVPIIAVVRKRNRCHNCDSVLWPDSPKFELVAAVLLGVATWRLGLAWALPAYLLFFSSLLLITVVDYRHYLIPNRVLYPTLFACMGLLAIAAVLEGEPERFVSALIGMAGAWFFFFVIWFAYPAGMGFGDVRLCALIGLMAGWLALGNVALSLLLGLLIGAFSGVVLMALRLRGRKDAIPFGPFLAVGATLSILAGRPIVDWWLSV